MWSTLGRRQREAKSPLCKATSMHEQQEEKEEQEQEATESAARTVDFRVLLSWMSWILFHADHCLSHDS